MELITKQGVNIVYELLLMRFSRNNGVQWINVDSKYPIGKRFSIILRK